ncbi:MAG TPA: N-6 DNA methylase [Polyangiaceae bacterium]
MAALAALAAHEQKTGRAAYPELSDEQVTHALRVGVLRHVVFALARLHGLADAAQVFKTARLFAPLGAFEISPLNGGRPGLTLPTELAPAAASWTAALDEEFAASGLDLSRWPPELIGNLYELLLAERVGRASEHAPRELSSGRQRKHSGTFFTPRALTFALVASALGALPEDSAASASASAGAPYVCDPAVGGGAFLLELARALENRSAGASTPERRFAILRTLCGVDVNSLAIAVAEAALWLFVADANVPFDAVGRNLRVGDALAGEPCLDRDQAELALAPGTRALDFPAEFPEVFRRGGFDLVIGNPPWVAYAGRAAAPLAPSRKAYFAAQYRGLRGYPTLHALFIERAAALAPRGLVALLAPSPIADLDGYRAVRRTLRATHQPLEPMLEFGQDAFESVTQPCFALLARHAAARADQPVDVDAPFRLVERQRSAGAAAEVHPPAVLARVAAGPSMPRELFGEMGFQTAAQVSKTLLRRAAGPDARYSYPLLEGRDVHEYRVGRPRLFLDPNREVLAAARCRLRPAVEYQRVRFVVRQTARYPIAALHNGSPFRNSLLAGFELPDLPGLLVVALLNSSLYRALHLGLRRDARQATFPQVKVAHLRALPLPPEGPSARGQLLELAERATRFGLDEPLRAALDSAVFELFGVVHHERAEIANFLMARGGRPQAATAIP